MTSFGRKAMRIGAAGEADCFPLALGAVARLAGQGRGRNRFLPAPGYIFAALLLWLSACRFSEPGLQEPNVLKQGERFFGQCA
ncbi:MAG TPA: hypothetical protein VM659_25835 [Dongiaceae bacterium]|nr:hypothetical protein [Dongiaceae bacterium]